MAKLFKIVNKNLFNVLASPNKEVYLDCLFIIYDSLDSYDDGFQGERDYIVSKLINYFDDNSQTDFEELQIDIRTSRQKANAVINYLKDTGWLGEEDLGNYKSSLNFFDYSIQLLETFKQIQSQNQIEYTGELYTIYSLITNFDIDEGVGIIEQAFKKTIDVIQKLKSLKANIYRYYYDIVVENKEQDLKELLEKLLVEYKNNFFDNAYYNLKTTDSISRYKQHILRGISNIYDDETVMDILTKNVMVLKKINNYNDAFIYIEDKIRYIINSFGAFESLIQSIDRKNEQYISAATTKILFLTNRSDDIEGIFNRLFTIVLSSDDKTFDYSNIFNLFSARNLDTESLYTERKQREESIPEQIDLFYDIDDNLKREKIANLLKNNIFGKKEIDSYVSQILDLDKTKYASQFPLQNEQDFIKLILIYLYSRSNGMHYKIEQTLNEVVVNFIRFKDFTITKK